MHQSLNSGHYCRQFSVNASIDIGNNGTWDITPTTNLLEFFLSAGANSKLRHGQMSDKATKEHINEVCTMLIMALEK